MDKPNLEQVNISPIIKDIITNYGLDIVNAQLSENIKNDLRGKYQDGNLYIGSLKTIPKRTFATKKDYKNIYISNIGPWKKLSPSYLDYVKINNVNYDLMTLYKSIERNTKESNDYINSFELNKITKKSDNVLQLDDSLNNRKDILIPAYIQVVLQTETFYELLNKLYNGEKVMIIDRDGPEYNLFPNGQKVEMSLLKSLINDPNTTYCFGYILCMLLLVLIGE